MNGWLLQVKPHVHIMLNEGGRWMTFTAVPKNSFYYFSFRIPFTRKWVRLHTQYRVVYGN